MNTIIEKIRAEVERLKKEHQEPTFRGDEYEEGGVNGYQLALDKVLAKLDALQEQPVCDGLEDVADILAEEHGFVKKPNFKPAKYSWSAVRDVFIEGVLAGAKWQMGKDLSSINKSYESGVVFGMNAQKEQMIKGAIDVTLNYTHQITLEGGEGFGKKGEHIKFIIVKGD